MSKPSQISLSTLYKKSVDDNLKKAGPAQQNYDEFPKFPYLCLLEGQARREGFIPPVWAPPNYKRNGFLSTRPTPFELRNLLNQVHAHFESLSPLTFESQSKTGGVHSTRYPIPLPSNVKATYYIIRVRTYHRVKYAGRERVWIEFLFSHIDNYLVAWRVVRYPSEFKTAYWCLFTDSTDLNCEGPLKDKCRQTQYTNAYYLNHLEKVKFYDGVLDDIESFLKKLYLNPDADTTPDGFRFFQTLFVLLGERFPDLVPLMFLCFLPS